MNRLAAEKYLLAAAQVALNLREGRQTQHRVPMKHQPSPIDGWLWHAQRSPTPGLYLSAGTLFEALCRDHAPWQPGDVLYVRECWALVTSHPLDGGDAETIYRADYIKGNRRDWWNESRLFDGRWRPSIHMPKRAARTWLHVKRVWVELVQDISEEDARAEGCPSHLHGSYAFDYEPYRIEAARGNFRRLWDARYPGSWERNDWLWCCELELDRKRSGLSS